MIGHRRILLVGFLFLVPWCNVLVAHTFGEDPPFYADKTRLLVWRDADGNEHPVTSPSEWDKRRAHILANLQLVMGALPEPRTRVPLDVQMAEEVKEKHHLRRKLTFAVDKKDRVPAYLLIPLERQGKLPAVLCLHQTNGSLGKGSPAGLGGSPDLHYAIHLVERGYVTLAPDYPSFGEYACDFSNPAYGSGSIKAVWNNMRAIDLLQSLPEVDGEHIGCIGHSLGGHNAMFTAAFDPRIKALVSNCGFTSFPRYYGGNLKGWTSPRYMPLIASRYESKPERMPFDFPEVVASFAPRAFLASAPTGDSNFEVSGVRDCLAAARPVYQLLGAKEKLAANYPECKHEFSEDARRVAYEWLDQWLK
jgi:pimeloyl-ACP methyl ester carboxylesterase